MSGVAEKIHGIGIGLGAIARALLRDDDAPPPPAAPSGHALPQERATTRLCRKPQCRGWHCYEVDGHAGPCNLERDEGAP